MRTQLTLTLLFCSLIIYQDGISQSVYENHYKKWYFGDQAGIDFTNNNIPIAITGSSLVTYDYGAAICDLFGNTLFYTNGETVWNSNNQVMTNGTGLSGSITGGQTVMTIRINSEDSLYYIFTVPEFASADGFRYHIVDMQQSGGLGTVVIKNQLLFAPSAEKIGAIFNEPDNTYWVIAHQWGNNNFAAYKLNLNGLDTVPVISSVGHVNLGGVYGGWHDATGQMSISLDGTKIACAYSYSDIFELYDFDINTGIISNPITITNIDAIWGIEFSPDCKKLYTTHWAQTQVNQFDLTNYNPVDIAASETLVGTVPASGSYAAGFLELGPDGKIYIAKWNGISLSQIDFPNNPASSCGFTNNGLNLSGGISQCGLSPSPVFPVNTTSVNESVEETTFNVYPNPASDQFTISLKENYLTRNLQLNMISIEGKKIKTIKILTGETTVNCEDIAPGNYTCELVENGKAVAQEKITLY